MVYNTKKSVHRREKRWTPEEDEILLIEVNKVGSKSPCWTDIAELLPERTNKSCRKRWIHSINPQLRKGRWDPCEDAALTAAVEQHGMHWYQIARTINNGRTDDQCAKRWREALDPTVRREPWTGVEDDLLIEQFHKCGRKWHLIAEAFDGRPSVQCRNRFLSLCKQGRIDDPSPVKLEFGAPAADQEFDSAPVDSCSPDYNESRSDRAPSPYFQEGREASPPVNYLFISQNPPLSAQNCDSASLTSSRRTSTSSAYSTESYSSASSAASIPTPRTPLFNSSLPLPQSPNMSSHVQFEPIQWQPQTSYPTHPINSYGQFYDLQETYQSYPLYNGHQLPMETDTDILSPTPLSYQYDASSTATYVPSASPMSTVSSLSELSYPNYHSSQYQPCMPLECFPTDSYVLEGEDDFTMTCPVPYCSYHTQSTMEIWRHMTWGHVSCRTTSDGAMERAVEQLVMGQHTHNQV